MTEKIFKSEQEYLAKLWKVVYTDIFNVLKMSLKLVSYREEILQIWQKITSLATKEQAAAFFKEVNEKCFKIFKE